MNRMPEQASPLDSDRMAAKPAGDAERAMPSLLVIDDDGLHRMIICRCGSKAGYAPAGAATFEEAVKLTQKTKFDCVTLDLSLGAHVGIEVLHHLQAIGCNMPIIVISGCDEVTCQEAVKLAKLLGLNVWQSIPKPVDLAVLRYWLERLRLEADAAAVAA
jgi:two-component system, chemotaxis family, chemotaxis protein CheY